VIASL